MTRRAETSLRGLVRLRSLRERDSRLGLATALIEENAAAAQVRALEEQVSSTPEVEVSDLSAFRARQHRLEALVTALSEARTAHASAHRLALAARSRWVEDRSRLAAVESLVARRAAAVREERRRRENRELDAIGEDLWRRAQMADTPSSDAS
ncbi:flagellar FliJ family protein [Nocardioides sp.]|uniref:flagellar FliJ family protein n=1 Tax=Nocardioides sp. TaxID=35761 RepID=UPI002637033E|nr:flagellar FliJ family protein [Nocardioides sp.]MDI6909283.1 flagellar FliJ family protein [Nocardioides sp.]